MPSVSEKLSRLIGSRGDRRRSVVSACVTIALALALFFVALFAPYRYHSDKEVLHFVSQRGDGEDTEEPFAVEYGTRYVSQSLYRLFEAAACRKYADVLNALTSGSGAELDIKSVEAAQNKLKELRRQYDDIRAETLAQAKEKGVSENSEKFSHMLARNLGDMNLIALDMMETAFKSDNTGIYDAIYAGVTLGIVSAVVELIIMVAAAVAVVFAALSLLSKVRDTGILTYMLLTIPSMLGLLISVYNPVMPPAASPVATACIAVCVFYAWALLCALADGGSLHALIKNAVAGALVPAAFLCLAALPSLTLNVNGLGGNHLYYPGSVGTTLYSRVNARVAIGLEIPHTAVTVSYVFGILISLMCVICSAKALERLYNNVQKDSYVFIAVAAATALIAVVYVAVLAGINAKLDGVRYIAGACWYIIIAFTAAAAVCLTVFAVLARKNAPQEDTEPETAAPEAKETEGPAAE